VDPVPDPLLLGKTGSAGNRTRTSDHYSSLADSVHGVSVQWTFELTQSFLSPFECIGSCCVSNKLVYLFVDFVKLCGH
jgi:hypothetical protein